MCAKTQVLSIMSTSSKFFSIFIVYIWGQGCLETISQHLHDPHVHPASDGWTQPWWSAHGWHSEALLYIETPGKTKVVTVCVCVSILLTGRSRVSDCICYFNFCSQCFILKQYIVTWLYCLMLQGNLVIQGSTIWKARWDSETYNSLSQSTSAKQMWYIKTNMCVIKSKPSSISYFEQYQTICPWLLKHDTSLQRSEAR